MPLLNRGKAWFIYGAFVVVVCFAVLIGVKWFVESHHKPAAEVTASKATVAAVGTLIFDYFLPFSLLRGGELSWYSISPATVEFKHCPVQQHPVISFLPQTVRRLPVTLYGVSILGGLRCDDVTNNCYYQDIRLVVGGFENIFRPQMYYAVHSDVRMDYVIYCCDDKECGHSTDKLISLRHIINSLFWAQGYSIS